LAIQEIDNLGTGEFYSRILGKEIFFYLFTAHYSQIFKININNQ